MIRISDEIVVSVEMAQVKERQLEKLEIKPKTEKISESNKCGFCIRTGVPIPFNTERPLSYEAFKKWNEFGDPNYPERFCHFSGEPSNGETSFGRPVLKKNWNRAKEIFEL